jgi:hypothetical protein
MANGITWVYSAKSGYIPCGDLNDVEKFRKAGYEVLSGKPSAHKSMVKLTDVAIAKPYVSEAITEESKELSKEELIELAADSGVVIDKRWNLQRIKEALGL